MRKNSEQIRRTIKSWQSLWIEYFKIKSYAPQSQDSYALLTKKSSSFDIFPYYMWRGCDQVSTVIFHYQHVPEIYPQQWHAEVWNRKHANVWCDWRLWRMAPPSFSFAPRRRICKQFCQVTWGIYLMDYRRRGLVRRRVIIQTRKHKCEPIQAYKTTTISPMKI